MSTPTRHFVAKKSAILDGHCQIVKIPRGKSVLEIGVFRIGEKFYAYRNVCPHAGAPVCEGWITGTTRPSKVYEYDYSENDPVVRCPWHGWEFDLRTGRHLVDEDTKLRSYTVESGGENLEAFPVETTDESVFILV